MAVAFNQFRRFMIDYSFFSLTRWDQSRIPQSGLHGVWWHAHDQARTILLEVGRSDYERRGNADSGYA